MSLFKNITCCSPILLYLNFAIFLAPSAYFVGVFSECFGVVWLCCILGDTTGPHWCTRPTPFCSLLAIKAEGLSMPFLEAAYKLSIKKCCLHYYYCYYAHHSINFNTDIVLLHCSSCHFSPLNCHSIYNV